MSEVIYLSNVRISFPHLVEPQRQINEQTGKERISYNADFIMEPSNPGLASFMQQYSALALDKWKEHAGTVMQMILNDRKTRCFGKGEERVNKKTFLPYDGYAGQMFVSAGRDTPPQIIQPDGNPIEPSNTMAYQQLTRKIYGGCRVNVAVKPWVQDNKHGRGIRCDLVAVQFLADDKAFGEGTADASGMFAPVSVAVPVFAQAGSGMPTAPFLPSFLTS